MNTTATVHYGNACAQAMTWVNNSSFLDRYFSDLNSISVLSAEDPIVKEELHRMAGLSRELNDENLKRFKNYDRGLQSHVLSFKFIDDEDANDNYRQLIPELFNDVQPLVYKLKLHYHRPRPFQLAALNGVALYPQASLSANCPAFPSFHACMAVILSEVIGNRFPQAYQYFKELENDIIASRNYMGLCTRMDIEAAFIVAGVIIKDREFMIKYRL